MKHILTLILLILGFSTQAQTTVDSQYYNRSKSSNVWNGVVGDSILGAPRIKAAKGKYPGSIVYNSSLKTLEVYDSTTARWYPLSPILFDGLISGGVVSWTGTGLNFYVSEANYIIGGIFYSSNDTTVTLTAADPTNPRQDVIALNSIGVHVLTGTPAADPAKPQVTPGSELELTSVLINAGATTPGGITQFIIYDENTESTFSTTLTANADNTTNPFHLTKAVDVGAGSGVVAFTLPTGITLTDYSVLVFYIRLKDTYPNNVGFNVSFRKTGLFNSTVTNNVTVTNGNYGYNRLPAGQYQTIQIPMSAFTFTQSPSNVVTLTLTMNGAGAGFYLDYIQLQSGVTVISNSGVSSFNARTGNVTPLKADYAQFFLDTTYRRADSVFGTKDGVERFLFTDSTGGGGIDSTTFIDSVNNRYSTITEVGDTLRFAKPNGTYTDIIFDNDTTVLASFAAGSGAAGDTTAFTTSAIYGSFYNGGLDTLVITNLRIGLQGTSPSVTATVYYNDSLNVTAGATELIVGGTAATNIYTGTSGTPTNQKIPPNTWCWVKTTTVTTKPTYFSLTLSGYRKR